MTYLTKISACFIFVVAVALGSGNAVAQQPDPAMTEQVLGHHLTAFGEGDVAAIMSDYTADSVILTPAGALHGLDQIRPLFEGLVAEFGKPGASFAMSKQIIEGDLAYIVWSAETADNVYEVATDTFIVRNGKIFQQTFAGKITPKK